MVEVFAGSFVLQSRDNFEPFMKAIGIPDDKIAAAKNDTVETEITVKGNTITVTRKRPERNHTNVFTLGQVAEIEDLKGEKVKVTVKLEGGKLVAKGDDYSIVSEIVGGKLKETITLKGHTMTRIFSKK